MTDLYATQINSIYGSSDFGDAILTWLREQGKNLDALTVEDLAPVDQLHFGGLAATRGLAELARVSSTTRIADLGGGIGGAARFLAASLGCTVDVVDLTAEFCRVGEMLTKQLRLGDKVRFHCESATATGLQDGAYDLVWMQTAAMNIEDRPALYREIRRLLRPGGRHVFQEAWAGDGGPPYYPVNFALSAEESFLQSPEAVLRMFLEAGFRVLFWEDETEARQEIRQQEMAARLAISRGAVPHYQSPETLREVAKNANRNWDEDRQRLGRGLVERI